MHLEILRNDGFFNDDQCKLTTAFTIAIARAMGLSGEHIRILSRGAFLHDVGIPDAILGKAGALTPGETAVMQGHCERGFRLLKTTAFLAESADMVYSDHEKFDGTGYPRGLKGAEIPLGARVLAVADTLDAITSNRPYRAAQSLQAARAEIELWSGRQFDPQIVNIFLRMPEYIWIDLREALNT